MASVLITGTSKGIGFEAGPDAAPFLEWRRQMTDEQWVELNASDDETWYRNLERAFGLDTQPKN